MTDDFVRFKSMDGEVFISKSSISSIKQLRTKNLPTLSGNLENPYSTIDNNYNYLEITLKEIDTEGHNVVINVKSELDAFLQTYFK